MKAIITVGMPSSDKAEFTKALLENDDSYVDVSRDIIRRELFSVGGHSEYEYSQEAEHKVTLAQFEKIRHSFAAGKNIIIADTNLRMKYVKGFVSLVEKLGHSAEIKIFDMSLVECIRRRSTMSNNIDPVDIAKKYDVFVETKKRVIDRYPNITEVIV